MFIHTPRILVLLTAGLCALPALAADRWQSHYRTDRPGYTQNYRDDGRHSHQRPSHHHHHANHYRYPNHFGDALAVAALASIAYVATRPSYPVVVERQVYSYSNGGVYGNGSLVVSETYPVTSFAQPVYSTRIDSTGRTSSGRVLGQTYRYYCSEPAGYSPDVDHCRGGWSRVPVN